MEVKDVTKNQEKERFGTGPLDGGRPNKKKATKKRTPWGTGLSSAVPRVRAQYPEKKKKGRREKDVGGTTRGWDEPYKMLETKNKAVGFIGGKEKKSRKRKDPVGVLHRATKG